MTLTEIVANVTGLKGELDSLKAQVSGLTQAQADLQTAKASLASAEKITKDLEAQITALTSKVAELTAANTKLEADLKATKETVGKQAAEIAAKNMATIGVQPPVADATPKVDAKATEQKPRSAHERFIALIKEQVDRDCPLPGRK